MNKFKIGQIKEEKYISPELHSQFIEFLGNCISEGIWVGEDSLIPNYKGMRKGVVDAMKRLAPPVVRWPGGCYADMYHWRDGIGSKNERKVTWNENFGTYEQEENEFGTHEFMEFCKMICAKPWLNVNMLRGSVEEMVEWAEYCNRSEATTLSGERERNGSKEPFNVEYWGLGNECWAGGGNYTAEGYAAEYRKYASAMPNFKPADFLNPIEGLELKMIACGPDGNKPKERVNWTKDFFSSLGKYRTPQIDGYDLHFYNWNLNNQNEADWYRVINSCKELEEVIEEQYHLIQEGISNFPEVEGDFPGAPVTCKLIIGEWGNWHWSAFVNRPALFQQCTMRDAITTAMTLDIFHRNSDKVSMACVAQTVNVLNALIITQGEYTILTPNYYVFEMYKVHRGGHATELEMIESHENIYSFASVKDNIISISIVNADIDAEQEITLTMDCPAEVICGRVLKSDSPDACNDAEHPNRVITKQAQSPVSGNIFDWVIRVPAASVSVYQFKKE